MLVVHTFYILCHPDKSKGDPLQSNEMEMTRMVEIWRLPFEKLIQPYWQKPSLSSSSESIEIKRRTKWRESKSVADEHRCTNAIYSTEKTDKRLEFELLIEPSLISIMDYQQKNNLTIKGRNEDNREKMRASKKMEHANKKGIRDGMNRSEMNLKIFKREIVHGWHF